MMEYKRSLYINNDVRELQRMGNEISGQDNFSPTLLHWLITQATRLGASELHIDWINGFCNVSLRIDRVLRYVSALSLNRGSEIVNAIKAELRISSLDLPETWSGELLDDHIPGRKYAIHLIKFQPLESVIIRLRSQKQALPSWTNSPGINKKIFIWQMGKVGSLTVFNSLQPYTNNYKWQHSIDISDEPYHQYNNIIHTHSAKPIYHTLHHSEEEFIVISLVRDLLNRNISAVFHNMVDNSPGNPYFIAPMPVLLKWDYVQFHAEVEKKLRLLNLREHSFGWYDSLFKSHFFYPDVDRYHVDVYSHSFDQLKGMQVYSSKVPRIKLVIIRMESLNNLVEEIGSFMGIEQFVLRPVNIAKQKWYSDIYRKFKERYSPTKQELDHVYHSKFMNYFYGTVYNNSQIKNYS